MRWRFVARVATSVLPPACDCNHHHSGNGPDGGAICTPAGTGDSVWRYNMCVPPPEPCGSNADCPGDKYCDAPNHECLPWGVGPGGGSDPGCKRDPVPGVFFPGAQCEWLAPPAGDLNPNHVNVLATPMVATFYAQGELSSPSIVFTSYNFTDGGAQSCAASDPMYYGVIRIIDGRTSKQQATIASPTVIASASEANADNGGNEATPEFDADGRAEFAAAGATAYAVFDPDCTGTPDPATCASMTTNGVLWADVSQDLSSNVTGSSEFDFDGDGRAEVVYGDECFTRVYDGLTGKVVYSRYRTSCTWYENPVIADVDADFNAEIVSTSNTNCSVACPAVDPIFDGVQCRDPSDCPSTTTCGRENATDVLGRCRCTQDADCGGDGFVCLDPIAGPSAAGKVCRASHPAGAAATGVRVLADSLDRWVNTRPIWNQHAYSVTNVDQNGKVPRTSQWLQNWKQPGLNNFRQNTPGDGETAGAIPDLTVRQAKVTCDAGGPTVTAEICDRGTEPVAPGVPVAVYDSAGMLRCTTQTLQRINPGFCANVSCTWTGANGSGDVVADDKGDGTGIDFECREDNNKLAIDVSCP